MAEKFTIHWPNWETPATGSAPNEPYAMLCGAPHLAREMYTENVEHLTCPDCLFRVIAILHRDMAICLKTLAGQFAIVSTAAERARRRD